MFYEWFFGKYYNRLGRIADALIFVSNAQRNLIVSMILHIKEKSYVTYNPILDIPYIKLKVGA